MNEPPPLIPDPQSGEKPPGSRTKQRWLGFGLFLAPLLAAVGFHHSPIRGTHREFAFTLGVQCFLVLLPCTALALVFACVRPTRSFGQGALIATGLGWLLTISLCGGAWR